MSAPVTVQASTTVTATPEQAFALVADLTRMGQWSSECGRVRWIDPRGPRPGAKFRGYNRRGFRRWRTTGTVTGYEPGRLLEWHVSFLWLPMSAWSYRFEPDGSGCRITEQWVDRQLFLTRPALVGWLVTGTWHRAQRNAQTMNTTLERLKQSIDHELSKAAGT